MTAVHVYKMDYKLICVWIICGVTTLGEAGCQICGGVNSDLVISVKEAKDRAVQWLADQQNVDGSWPNVNTQNAILALQLADPNWMASQSLDSRLLTTSRLEYELMQYLLSSKFQCRRSLDDLELGGGRLGQYMLALNSVCAPIDDFYGIDLSYLMIRLLKDFPEDNFNNFFQYSFAIMPLCSSNSYIFKKALTKLADGFNSSDPCVGTLDVLSLQVIAMTCVAEQDESKLGVASWETVLNSRVQCIADSQLEADGSFGNAMTTALAIQALTAANADGWDCVSSMEWLLTQQTENGGFDGVGATAQILPILGCNNFGSLGDININCPHFTDLPNPVPIGEEDETVDFGIQVNVDNTTTDYLTSILDGENLYFGMIRLEESSNNFSFVSTDSSFGQSLQEINGVANDPAKSNYWTIHINEKDNYAATGIEGLFPTEGITYIFIYTNFS